MAELKGWEVDEKGMAEMLRQDGVTKLLAEVAAQAVEVARSLAPVWSGDYLESLGVVPMQIIDGKVVAGFGSSSWRWHFVEYGSTHNVPLAVLRNAALAAVGGTGVEIL